MCTASSAPPEAARGPAAAAHLIGAVWEGYEKRGVRVLREKPQINFSYEPATNAMVWFLSARGFPAAVPLKVLRET